MSRNRKLKIIISIVVMTLFSNSAIADDIATDSIIVTTNEDSFKPKQLIVPGILLTAGIAGAIKPDNAINTEVDSWFGDNPPNHVDDYLRWAPSALHLGLCLTRLKARHRPVERLMMSVTAHALMFSMTYGLKVIVSEQRPDGSDCNSFPSGHVALAFTGAELLRLEYGSWVGATGYVLASYVAMSRIIHHQHWLSDVLMGAGIGILSARAAGWLLPIERRLFRIDNEKNNQVFVLPYYDTMSHGVGLSCAATF